MTTSGNENGASRNDLVERIELMETMIAEGRRSTTRRGWIFLLWGMVSYAAIAWEIYLPQHWKWAWPVCGILAYLVSGVVVWRQRRSGQVCGNNLRTHSIRSIWRSFAIGISLYVFAAIASGHCHGPAYFAAISIFLGIAHSASAMILRWRAQGLVGGIWIAGGMATFFVSPDAALALYLVVNFFGMVLFGLYAMMLDRRGWTERAHA